jgi:long-subunit fatty acid transport protein
VKKTVIDNIYPFVSIGRCVQTTTVHAGRNTTSKTLFFLVTALLLACSAPVKATFIEQMAIDTRGMAMANTCTANPPGHMSIHYNPAGLSKIAEGSWWHQGVILPQMWKYTKFRGNPDFPGWLQSKRWDHSADPIYKGKEVLKAEGKAKSGLMYLPILNQTIDFAISPRTVFAHKSEASKWTFATGMYTPYATGANHSGKGDPTWFGSRRGVQQHLIYQHPTASYQVSPELSIGMGVGTGQTAQVAEVRLRSPNDLTALTRELGEATKGMAIPPWTYLYYKDPLYGGGIHPWEEVAKLDMSIRNDFSPSYKLGALYEPYEWLGFGMVYQSEIIAKMSGSYKITYGDDFMNMVDYYGSGPWGVRNTSIILDLPINPTRYQSGVLNTTIKFPRRIQVGLRYSPVKRLNLMFDLKWSEWSIRQQDKFSLDQDIQLLQVAKLSGHKYGNRTLVSDRFMKDTLDWGISIEYKLSEKIDLLAGYEFRKTSVNTKYMDLTTPIADMHYFGCGLSRHLPNGGRLDFAVAWARTRAKLDPEESTNLTSTNYFWDGTNMFAGQYYEGDLDVLLVSVGFVVPFESYATYQKGNREKIAARVRFLHPFKRVQEKAPDSLR